MGQEVGHAFEDLLQIALELIVRKHTQTAGRTLRLAPYRRIKGISGNIDHLLELSSDGKKWRPFLLFMEKHSDSADNSHLHFRRHLEEYIQAKVASIEHFAFPRHEPIAVVNLIYGLELTKGWKPAIINESKRLLHPTLFLPDHKFYKDILSLIQCALKTVGTPYPKEKVRAALLPLTKRSSSFGGFVELLQSIIFKFPKPPASQMRWLSEEIERSLRANQVRKSIQLPTTCYLRKALTQLLLIDSKAKKDVLHALHNQGSIELGGNTSIQTIRELGKVFGKLVVTRRVTGKAYISLSKELSTIAPFAAIDSIVNEAASFFLDPTDPRLTANRDYLAYFDVTDKSFGKVIYETACAFIAFLTKDKNDVLSIIARTPSPCAAAVSFRGRVAPRVQNLALETIMAVSSLVVSELNRTRTDMSTSTIARLSGITEAKVNAFRSGGAVSSGNALRVAQAAKAFCESAENYTKRSCSVIGRRLVSQLNRWLISSQLTDVAETPELLDRTKVMSVAWMRQNQLCSHSIFNPISVMLLQLARKNIPQGWTISGFPYARSANPMETLNLDSGLGLDYEFTIVCRSNDRKQARIFETSSVQGFKHTSDKCKELCARMRCVKALCAKHAVVHSTLVVDGDWRAEHVSDLGAAGWDQVIHSADLLHFDR
jgi:hypothetical protein